ncbi:hypothetical protein Tco_1252278 [Tanacetum coccineum]
MYGEESAPQMAPVESPHVVSSVKLPILKKGEYTLWSMRMEQYLTNTDYALWQVIMNGDEPIQTTKDENDVETKVPEVPMAQLSHEDANQKFLRALPSSWNNVALIMRNKTSIDDLDIDDLYNNLKVPYSQGQTSSSIYTDDLMFLFFANQLNIPQLDDEDLEQIDHDDLEEMDLNGRRGHFAKECRTKRNQGNKNGDAGYRSRDNTRRTIPVETSDALVVQDNALIVQDLIGI